MRRCVTQSIEPLPATPRVSPTFRVYALRVVAEEEVFGPRSVVYVQAWSGKVRFTAVAEFSLVSLAAVRAFDPHHDEAAPLLSDRRQPQRLRQRVQRARTLIKRTIQSADEGRR
jgi:hypothetical protein